MSCTKKELNGTVIATSQILSCNSGHPIIFLLGIFVRSYSFLPVTTPTELHPADQSLNTYFATWLFIYFLHSFYNNKQNSQRIQNCMLPLTGDFLNRSSIVEGQIIFPSLKNKFIVVIGLGDAYISHSINLAFIKLYSNLSGFTIQLRNTNILFFVTIENETFQYFFFKTQHECDCIL